MSSIHAPYLSFVNINYSDMDFYLQAFWVLFLILFLLTGGQQINPKKTKRKLDKTISDQVPCCFEPYILT